MRILRVAPWIYPDAKGGGGYHVHAMSRDQAAMGHDVTVLTTRSDPSLPRVEETHGYTVYRVSPGVELLGNEISPGMARFLWHVDADDYDVIHAHSHYYFSTNLAALVLLGGVTNVPRVKAFQQAPSRHRSASARSPTRARSASRTSWTATASRSRCFAGRTAGLTPPSPPIPVLGTPHSRSSRTVRRRPPHGDRVVRIGGAR